MSQNISWLGNDYQNVPYVQFPKTGGGTARFDDATVTTAIASDVAQGKMFLAADGTITPGTASGGGDNVLVVTLSWDDDYFGVGEGAAVPDKTFSEISTAYYAGKTIVVRNQYDDGTADGWYVEDGVNPSNDFFSYWVNVWMDGYFDSCVYNYNANGITIDDDAHLIYPNFDSPSVTYTPTESQQTEVITYDTSEDYNGIEEVSVTVNAIPSNYVGSGITRRSSSDLTASGATVTAPAGYYASAASKSVATGTAGTPTATKGTVSNHSVSVTPSVTNTAGYISGGTHNGTAVSVSASELVSGTKSITAAGNTDVTNYATASVASGGATASASKGTVSNHSITVTPSVTKTAGYITAGTSNGTAVTVSASELVSGSETKTANGTYDVTNLAEVVVSVSGGGGSDRLVLLQTTSLGALSTSSTSAADTGKTVSLASSTNWDDYDLLIVDISVNSTTNGRHTSTVSGVLLTGTSNVTTKNTYTVMGNKWNSKLSSNGTASTRQSTTAYGVYINAASASSGTLTLTVYYRYNSNSTGTLNGTYTARVYGIKLIDLIGG